jgi:putative transposase
MSKMIYTTNQIENFNRQLWKVSKSRTIFPTDDSLFKVLYLGTIEVTNKWSGRNRDWNKILSQFCIYFEKRIESADLE